MAKRKKALSPNKIIIAEIKFHLKTVFELSHRYIKSTKKKNSHNINKGKRKEQTSFPFKNGISLEPEQKQKPEETLIEKTGNQRNLSIHGTYKGKLKRSLRINLQSGFKDDPDEQKNSRSKLKKSESKVQNKRTEEKPGHRKSDEKTKVVNLNK